MKPTHEQIKYPHDIIPINWIVHTPEHAKGGYVLPHWHASMEISYTVQGSISRYHIKSTSYETKPGTILVINPGEIHGPIDTLVEDTYALTLQIPYSLLSTSLPNLDYQRIYTHLNEREEKQAELAEIQSILGTLYELLSQDVTTIIALKVTSLCYEVLYLLIRDWSYETTDSLNQLINGQGLIKMEKIILYIQDSYEKDLSIQSIADYFHISPFYLSKLFKNHLGSGVMSYVQQVRTVQAERMLRESSLSIRQISENVGFKNEKSFRKSFTNMYHMTPKKYQLNDKKNK